MPTLNQLLRNRATVEIPTEGDPLRIEYQPAAITPRLEAIADRLHGREDITRGEETELMTEYLVSVVHAWNLNEPDGTPVPVTPETIAALDYEAKAILFTGIRKHIQPGEVPGANSSEPSDSTSSPVATRATTRRRSRTGTR